MSAKFENYGERKGMWFWMMLSLGAVISEDPKLSAKKTDELVKDFLDSASYQIIFAEDDVINSLFRKTYG